MKVDYYSTRPGFYSQIALGILIILIHLAVLSSNVLQRVESAYLDNFFKIREALPVSSDIVIVEVDESSIQTMGRWPWPRSTHAKLLDALNQWGAKAVMLDILFGSPTESKEDQALEEAIAKTPQLYLPVFIEDVGSQSRWAHSLDAFEDRARGLGHINIQSDPDGILRRIKPYLRLGEESYPQLSVAMASDERRLERSSASLTTFPLDSSGNLMINWTGPFLDHFKRYSYMEILYSQSMVERGLTPFIKPEAIKDKICLVGITAVGLSDRVITPTDLLCPGIGVNANILNMLLTRKFVYPAGPVKNGFCLILMGVIATLYLAFFKDMAALLGTAGFGVAWFSWTYWNLAHTGEYFYFVQPVLLMVILFVFSTMFNLMLSRKERNFLAEMATRDGLTGLYQIRYFRILLQQAFRLAAQKREAFAILMIDIDHFKNINDSYGHMAGDLVLQLTAQRIRASIREIRAKYEADYVARYGGEEFIVFLRNTPLDMAVDRVAERVRRDIEKAYCKWGPQRIAVTVSIGVAALNPEEEPVPVDELIRRADVALYQAKHGGRNRVCRYQGEGGA